MRDDRARRATCKEHVAAKQTANSFGVSVTVLSLRRIRRWEKKSRDQGKRGLLDNVSDKGGRQPLFSLEMISFVVLLRTLCEWGAIPFAPELRNQGIAPVSHQTEDRRFKKYSLPTKTDHPKGKSLDSAIA